MRKRFSSLHVFPSIYWGIVIAIIFSLFWYTHRLQIAALPGTSYTYATGHLGDFYGYSYMIRRGQEGYLLYNNIYSLDVKTYILSHPFFHLIGLVTAPFSISPGFLFFIARTAAWIVLFWMVYRLITKTITTSTGRILAGVFFFSATSVWGVGEFIRSGVISMPVVWNDYFDLYSLYVRVPPHHVLAFVCMGSILLLLNQKTLTRRDMGIGIVLSICLGLLQPYLAFFFLAILSVYVVVCVIIDRKIPQNAGFIAVMGAICVCMIGMNYYLLQYIMRLPFAATSVLSQGGRYITFSTYLYSLGPLALLSFLAFANASYRKTMAMRYMLIWAWLPCVLFLLPEIGNLTSTNRLLQTYQHLPLALLAGVGVEGILRKGIVRRIVIIGMVVCALTYGFVPYAMKMKTDVQFVHTEYFNVYMPEYLRQAFIFFNTKTARDSMVLSGAQLGVMMPAFTHNRTLIGHDSNTPDFVGKSQKSVYFYQGSMSAQEAEDFLKEEKVDYVLFGLDAPSWEKSLYNGVAFLEPVYTNDIITIVRRR
jgi:hypothetical protein